MTRKADHVLRANIEHLLAARKEDQKTLAQWCGHDKSWINKFLNKGRGISLKDFDKIADFFGLETYQLFQPGISRLTERRSQTDRRTGQDRRIGHTNRLVSHLRMELNKVPHMSATSAPGASHASSRVSFVPPEVQAILADAEARIAAVYAESAAGGQAPRHRRARAGSTRRDRSVRVPHPDEAG
jgi:hypothetical protein